MRSAGLFRTILGLGLSAMLFASAAQAQPEDKRTYFNDQRRDAPKDATVVFYESPRGTPAAVKSWRYPGETIAPPQAAQNNAPRTARTELPRTASNLPFVGLIGMLSALGFVTLRFGQSRRS